MSPLAQRIRWKLTIGHVSNPVSERAAVSACSRDSIKSLHSLHKERAVLRFNASDLKREVVYTPGANCVGFIPATNVPVESLSRG